MVKAVTNKEYYILCRIVEAEAGDQDVYGRILVVNVILNRVNCKKEFANDIEGVVPRIIIFCPHKRTRESPCPSLVYLDTINKSN